MSNMKFLFRNPVYTKITLSSIGILDSIYLTYEHYSKGGVICPAFSIIDCGKVIRGPYSEIFGIPLALFGFLFYFSFFLSVLLIKKYKGLRLLKYYVLLSSSFAFLFSLYLVYLQLFVIMAICIYCMLSALTSTLIFIISINTFSEERKRL